MTPALPHPLRIVVKGSSLVVMVPERPSRPGEYTMPRWVQNGLLDRGRPCELDNRGVPGERTRHALGAFERDVLAAAPDAVVYAYGYYECIHALLPHWLERHVNSYRHRTGPVRQRYRSWVLRPVWKGLAQTQRVLDDTIRDRFFFGRRVRQVVRDYRLLIQRTRADVGGAPVVFVLELFGPGGLAPSWFPGMQSRIDTMNRALDALVVELGDPDVRLVPARALAEAAAPGRDPVPDGLHYSPVVRRAIGDWIAGEVDLARPARASA